MSTIGDRNMADGEDDPPRGRSNAGRDMAFEAELGARIRAARVAAGLTQRALGDAVGIAYQKLQKYELGQDRIAVSTLQRIARSLKIHPGMLFDDPMPTAARPDLELSVARRSLELVQAAPDPRVVGQLLALVDELGKGGRGRDGRAPALPQTRSPGGPAAERAPSAPGASMRGVVDPLVRMLRATGKGDAGALARLLGQALAQAEELLTKPS